MINLNYDDVTRWRCGQLLSRDFIVYKMKPSVRGQFFFKFSFGLDLIKL